MHSTPIVVQYLYVHEPEEGFYYPSVRAASSAAQVAQRYLECALTQVASLAYRDVDCELVLATNVTDRSLLGHRGEALLEQIEALGARVVHAPYEHRPREGTEIYVSSRYVLDAIVTASEGLDPARRLWLTDLDCVWAEPARCSPPLPATARSAASTSSTRPTGTPSASTRTAARATGSASWHGRWAPTSRRRRGSAGSS